VAASAGAACYSDTVEISQVLQAMSISLDWTKGTLRLSIGQTTTGKQIYKTIPVYRSYG